MKFLIPIVALGALFFAASPAKAAPAIPPTEECLALTQTMIDNYPNGVVSDAQERALLKPLVDAGCLERSPFSSKIPVMPKGECRALAAEVSAYLAPANAVARPIAKRLEAIEKKYRKQTDKLIKRLDKAYKNGNKKAIKKINRHIKKITNANIRSILNVVRANKGVLDQYLAPSFLVSLDMETRGCNPGMKWEEENTAIDTFLSIWVFSEFYKKS